MAREKPKPSWIMVPIPEELIPEVSEYIVGLVARASIDQWMPDSIAELLADSDEKTRALLSIVAGAALDNKELSGDAAAELLGVDEREISVLSDAVNEAALTAMRPILLRVTEVSEPLPNGETRAKVLIKMNDRVARMVSETERAARQSDFQS